MRASVSSVRPPVTLSRSCQYSSSGYASVSTSSGPSCIVRMLRVWRLLPPRKWIGADSTIRTLKPAPRAVMRGAQRGVAAADDEEVVVPGESSAIAVEHYSTAEMTMSRRTISRRMRMKSTIR